MEIDKKITKQTFSGFWKATMQFKLYFTVAAFGAVLAVVAQSILAPLIVSRVFAKLQVGFSKTSGIKFSSFVNYLVLYAVVMLIGVLLWRVQSYYTWKLEIKVKSVISQKIFKHLINLDQHFHANRFSGALVSQTNKYISAYERMMDDFIWNILPGISTLVFSVIVISFVSIPFAAGMLFLSLLYLGLMYLRVHKQMPANTKVADAESSETAVLADALTNIESIRNYANEDYENDRFTEASLNVQNASNSLSLEVFKSEALSHFQTNIFQILALLFGLIAVTRTHANISLLYLLISYTGAIVNQIWQFSRIVRNVNRSLGDAVEMTKIMKIQPKIQDLTQPEKIHFSHGSIEFNKVSFYYPGREDRPLFKDLNLRIKPGEKIGLVGPSGGGKTTFTKLILRVMDINSGEIRIDSQNIAHISQKDLRQHIAYVPQEPLLFHRSLKDNIRYGNPDASDQELIAVAKMAHADEFINQLEQGYETLVGERGIKLSGGQRQRIAIARAMLKNAPVLVLDEATSALDSVSESLIQQALWTLMENRTAIIVAHRLSTIQKMDRIIVLDNGEIIEQGSHKELIYLNGAYAELWTHQSGGFMAE